MEMPFGKLAGLVSAVTVVCAGLALLARGPVVSARRAAAPPSAESTFLDKRSVCHGSDGAGKTARGRKAKVKDVHETVKAMTEAEMITIVNDGKAPNMDAYAKAFSAAQIKALVEDYRGLAK